MTYDKNNKKLTSAQQLLSTPNHPPKLKEIFVINNLCSFAQLISCLIDINLNFWFSLQIYHWGQGKNNETMSTDTVKKFNLHKNSINDGDEDHSFKSPSLYNVKC